MERAGTSQVKISRLTTKGQMTLPKECQEKLSVGPGDYIALLEVDEGILIKKANILQRHLQKKRSVKLSWLLEKQPKSAV